MLRKDDIQQLIIAHAKRLQILKEQEALQGITVDPKIPLEIQTIEEKLEQLENELDHLTDNDIATALSTPFHKTGGSFFPSKRLRLWQWGVIDMMAMSIILITVIFFGNGKSKGDNSKQNPTPRPPSGLGAIKDRSIDGMAMVYVPAGFFEMGSDESFPNDDNEKPNHPVTLDAFWIDQIEINNTKYTRCVEAGTCRQSSFADNPAYNRADYPVVGVSWQDAVNYCQWVGGRLPTEAEWEYAAKGSEGRIYPWGDEFDGTKTNFCDANCPEEWKDTTFGNGFERTAPVGSFPNGASWVGALDMAGNVWEWVNDWYKSDYYKISPTENPKGPKTGSDKVLRGGSWYTSEQQDLRTTYRKHTLPTNRLYEFGFRCVVEINN